MLFLRRRIYFSFSIPLQLSFTLSSSHKRVKCIPQKKKTVKSTSERRRKKVIFIRFIHTTNLFQKIKIWSVVGWKYSSLCCKHLKVNEQATFHVVLWNIIRICFVRGFLHPRKIIVYGAVRSTFIMQLSGEYCICNWALSDYLALFAHKRTPHFHETTYEICKQTALKLKCIRSDKRMTRRKRAECICSHHDHHHHHQYMRTQCLPIITSFEFRLFRCIFKHTDIGGKTNKISRKSI